jgi:hypothetical protein
MMNNLNERLNKFYQNLTEAYSTVKFSNIFEDSMAFSIDYVDINELKLLPIIKASMYNNLTVTDLSISIKGGKKYLIGVVQLKGRTIELPKYLDMASLESEE